MVTLFNGFEQLGDGVTATAGPAGNTGGSGSCFDEVSVPAGGTLAGSSLQAAHGARSLLVSVGATAGAAYAGWSSSIGTVTSHYGRIYLRLAGSPSADDAFVAFLDSATGWAGGIQLTTGRQLSLQTASYGIAATMASVIPLNTWVRVEWHLVSGASGTLEVRYYATADGSSPDETASSGTAGFGTNLGHLRIGWTSASHASQPSAYVDDVRYSTTGWPGPEPQAVPVTVVQAKQAIGRTVILDNPTTAHNTLYLACAGNSAGSGTPAVTQVAYSFSFTVAGTPVSNDYFIVWQNQAVAIGPGDQFTDTFNPGTTFTVTSLDAPYAGFVNVRFTPSAAVAMSNPDVVNRVLGPDDTNHWAQQVSQAQGSQSYALAAIWQDPDCLGGRDVLSVNGTNLVPGDTLIWIVEVAGMGASPVLERSSTGPLGVAGTTWTSGASGTTAAGGGFVMGVTAHGPDRNSDSLTGPAAPWVNCTPLTWPGGAAIAGYQTPASAGDWTYSGNSVTTDYYTAVVAAFASSFSTYAQAGTASGAGGVVNPARSGGRAVTPDAATGTGQALFDAGWYYSLDVIFLHSAQAAGQAYDTTGLTPGMVAPGTAEGAGEAPFDAGWYYSLDLICDNPASASGQALSLGAGSYTIAYPGTSSGAGAALNTVTGPVSFSFTVQPAAASAEAAVPALSVLGLGSGQFLAAVASAASEGCTPVIFAFSQPVYLGACSGSRRALPLPGGSQVAVCPPGGGQWSYLGHLGHVTALKYSFVMPGGADKLTCVVKLPASLRTSLLSPGWLVRIYRGGHVVWTGRMEEPAPGPDGWTVTAVGDGQRGSDFTAQYTTWPAGQPDQVVNNAISRGLRWVNPGVGTPSWLWTGQQPDSGSQTVAGLLDQMCSRGGGTWYVDSQPGGVYGGPDLKLMPVPTVVNRLLLVTNPVPRTLGELVNRLVIRYQITADTTGDSGSAATYGLATISSPPDIAVHDVTEQFLDLSSAGLMTAATAQVVGAAVLSAYQRAAYAGPFTAVAGQLMTVNGVPVDPGCDQAGTVVRLIISDFGYGGEVTPATPVTFPVGGYEWDDWAGVATITPYQTADTSLQGLMSAVSSR